MEKLKCRRCCKETENLFVRITQPRFYKETENPRFNFGNGSHNYNLHHNQSFCYVCLKNVMIDFNLENEVHIQDVIIDDCDVVSVLIFCSKMNTILKDEYVQIKRYNKINKYELINS